MDTIKEKIKITEQGEVLASKYSFPKLALYHLETIATAVIQSSLLGSGFDRVEPWNEIMEELATRSRSVYRSLVYEQPDFVDFFLSSTPIDVISQLQIGSRPSKRPGKNSNKKKDITISHQKKLLDNDPELQRSVQLRNGTIVPLGFLQVALIERLREYSKEPQLVHFRPSSKEELLRGAMLTINGIAAGMRNTG